MTWRPIGSALGALAFITLAPATAADAAPAEDPSAERVCIVRVDTDLDMEEVSCGDDETEASAALSTRAAEWTTIARLYDPTDYNRPSVTIQWTAGRCSAEYEREFEIPNLDRMEEPDGTPIRFNNRISSIRTYNGCDVRLYQGLNLRGDHSTWIDRSDNLSNIGGGWNNQATSLEIS